PSSPTRRSSDLVGHHAVELIGVESLEQRLEVEHAGRQRERLPGAGQRAQQRRLAARRARRQLRRFGRLVRVEVERLAWRLEAVVAAELEARLDLALGELQDQGAAGVGEHQRAAQPEVASDLKQVVCALLSAVAEEGLAAVHARPPCPASTISLSSRLSSSWLSRSSAASTGKNPASVNIASDTEAARSEEHTSELQSRENLVCRLLL